MSGRGRRAGGKRNKTAFHPTAGAYGFTLRVAESCMTAVTEHVFYFYQRTLPLTHHRALP